MDRKDLETTEVSPHQPCITETRCTCDITVCR